MQETQLAIKDFEQTGLNEEQVMEVVEFYFKELATKKALGKDTTQKWSRFDHEEIHPSRLLRGDQEQVAFIVTKCDRTGTLRQRIEAAWMSNDRWTRRRELRQLAPEAAQITVNAWKYPKYQPIDIAEPFPNDASEPSFWFLDDQFYDEEIGFCHHQTPSSNIL